MERHVSSLENTTSLQAEIGDKTKVIKPLSMIHNMWSVDIFLMGTNKWKLNFCTSKNDSIINSFNSSIRNYEICTSQ